MISVRYSRSLAVPQDHEAVGRPLQELRHFTTDVFDSFWWAVCRALVFPEFEAVPLQVALSLATTTGASSAVVAIVMSSTYAQYSSSVAN